MVKISEILASNGRIGTELPAELVAVVPGATSGIGEYAVLALAKHAREPRIYLIGQSQSAADRIIAECKTINPGGQYTFIQTDASLIKNVDQVCREIKEKEKTINILFLSIGSLNMMPETSEGLRKAHALIYYARMRFIGNLLPLLQAAQGLRRVVTVLAGTKEGEVDENDIGCRRPAMMAAHSQMVTMVTLGLEEMARRAPTVSFIHDYPGLVKSNISRGTTGLFGAFLSVAMALSSVIGIAPAESGERHVFLATSAMYPPREDASGGAGADGVRFGVARGTDGAPGSGVYSIGADNENGPRSVDDLLARLRKKGTDQTIWEHLMGELERITGTPGMLA